MITMTEIARRTGVSQPTVSRVLNGNTAVNPQVRERVLACARANGFQPNILARSLAGSRTRLIGVILTDISNSFFADLVKYMEQEARRAGCSLILFNSGYDPDQEEECLDVIQRYRVDGLIAVPVNAESARWQERIQNLDIPAVILTRQAAGMDSVYVSHEEAGSQVGNHLWEEGFREYIFCGRTEDSKYQGFAAALAAHDPSFLSHLTVIRTKESAAIQNTLAEYFSKARKRTGIFAYNDRRAVQILGLLQKLGIRIPEQAGLVGFDNTYMCELLYPGLSSVSQPNEEMAVTAVRRLLYRIEHPKDCAPEDHPLSARLICRESSAGALCRQTSL